MRGFLFVAVFVVFIMVIPGCGNKVEQTNVPNDEHDTPRLSDSTQYNDVPTNKSGDLSTVNKYEDIDGWEITYPASWDKVEANYFQEQASGKTVEFSSAATSKDALEKWLNAEITRKLKASEAANTLYEPLSISKKGSLTIYKYSIKSRIESLEHVLRTTVFFDGKRRYEFRTSIPPVTEKEWENIINSFSVKSRM